MNNSDKKSTRRLVFLDSLLTQMHNEKLSLDDIQEEVDTFMFEGHDTTAAAVNFFCYLMGCNPDVQAKVHAEMDSIFGGISSTLLWICSIGLFSDDRERPCTVEDTQQMTYLDCCIKVEDNFTFNQTENSNLCSFRNQCDFFRQFHSSREKRKKISSIVSCRRLILINFDLYWNR